ncbi:Gfo/Idh/MocA family protein [Laribacter hongkongensis]|uniref:Gfo/Idh/MocA family protein n=1 Tax=Laribacter hongkongensis TaxID=168471 RepID=UPI001EFE9F5C|nr:Gfo/Idh/MocA family oxidoreductase [Laribacter hongkongensis]MCG9095357.1 Gfo/Idh/MocA family oxidoreductase [Laribacter hongkongensis]
MRFGVIGGGFGVDVHLPVLMNIPGVDVVAVADSGSGRALARLPSRFLYASSWRDFLVIPVDAVCVVTPPPSHLEAVLALVGRGKHVLCEKPFGMNPQQSREMSDAAANAGVVGGVTFQYRFEPGFQKLKALLDANPIGELHSVDCTWLTSGRRDSRAPWTWRNDAAQGGGVIGAFLSHVVDLFHWLLDARVQQVQARTDILVPRRPLADGSLADVSAEDWVQVHMTMNSGLAASCCVSNCHPQASGMRMELTGSKGSLVYTHRPPFTSATQEIHLSIGGALPQRLFGAEQVLEAESDTRLPALRGLLECFVKRAQGHDGSGLPGFEDGWAVQQVLHAVRQSAANHCSVAC